jgi:large subunit ribosomal protein L21
MLLGSERTQSNEGGPSMYAIFEAKGKQWRAEPGATLRLPSLEAEPGDRVVFDDVLLADRDGQVMVGRPSLEGAAVATEVVRHGKGEKIVVFKMKRRKNYRRKQGHRQTYTEVRVVDITLGSGAAAPKRKKAAAEKAPAPKAEKAAAPKAEKKAPKAEEKVEVAAEKVAPEKKEKKAVPKKEAAAETAAAVNITPAAAELASEHGIDVASIEGTGKDGRVLKSDVAKAIKARDEG